MALLGVILLLAGAGAGVVAYLATRGAAGAVTVTAFGFSRDASPIELVLYGAVAVLLFALGWALLSASARRRARLRREERASARISEVEESAETARLEHELDRGGVPREPERRDRDGTGCATGREVCDDAGSRAGQQQDDSEQGHGWCS